MNSHTHSQLTFNKGGKNIQWEKDGLFSKWCWKSCKSMKLEYTLSPWMKINSKWLKDLNIRHEIIKLIEENIGKTISDINCTNVFLGQCPRAIEIKTNKQKKGHKWSLQVFAQQRKLQTKLKDNLHLYILTT